MLAPPVSDVLRTAFLGNTLQAWLSAGLTAAVILFVGLVLRRVLVSRLEKLAARTTNNLDDMVVEMLKATRAWVLIALAVLIGAAQLRLPYRAVFVLQPALKLVVLWQLAVWLVTSITFWIRGQLELRTGTHDRASIAMINAMGVGAKVLIWVMIFLTALKSVFGVEITALITGLGVSGIAVALAVQNILGDLLAALAIVFDKPFDVGDTIGVDNITGTVENIGLKTTRVRSLSGEQIVLGNADLLKSRLRNYRRMEQRRVLFLVDVTYDTPPDLLARIPGMIQEIVAAQTPIRFDRSHVAALGESAIRIETVYFVLDPDYAVFMTIQQAVILGILRRFEELSIKFAFPSRTVYHETSNVMDAPAVPPRSVADG
jgi:small-conductance mechanosensitive channel